MNNQKILLISTRGIGDNICTTPIIRAIHQKYDNYEITLIASYSEIFKNNPYIDNIIQSGTREARNLIRHKLDYPIRYRMVDDIMNEEDTQRNIFLARKFGLDISSINNEIYLLPMEIEWAKNFITNYKPAILLQSSSCKLGGKQWAKDKWEELIKRLDCYDFLLVGSYTDTLIKGAVDLRGKTTLREAISLLSVSNLFVGIDSFLNHATNALGTKGVVLFGSSNPNMWGYKENINIYSKIECSPCFSEKSRECTSDNLCMKGISVNEVEAAIKRQLQL